MLLQTVLQYHEHVLLFFSTMLTCGLQHQHPVYVYVCSEPLVLMVTVIESVLFCLTLKESGAATKTHFTINCSMDICACDK